MMVHPVQMGKKVRMSYSKIDEVLDMPTLLRFRRTHTCGFWKGLKRGVRGYFSYSGLHRKSGT